MLDFDIVELLLIVLSYSFATQHFPAWNTNTTVVSFV